MKYTDLTPEQRKHFNIVVNYYSNAYREDFPEDATHVDFNGDPSTEYVLLKKTSKGTFFYNSFTGEWSYDSYPTENHYQIPDKPWYDPDDVGIFDGSDKNCISLNYKEEHGKKPLKYQETKFKPCKDTVKVVDDSPEKSTPTGGKSGYYLVEIPIDAPTLEIDHEKGVVRFMLEEYIKYGLNNDFDRGNIAKANHRLGKKLGVKVNYDLNKIEYYTKRIRSTSDE